MAVRRLDGVDDNIVCATGGLSGMAHGTVAVLVQRRATGDFYALMGVNDDINALLGSVLMWNNSDWTWFTSAAGSKSTTPSPLNTWALLVVRKDAGSAVPRFSIFNYGTSSWVHENGDASQGDWTAPGAGGSVEFSDAGNDSPNIRVAARAAWANSLPWSTDAAGDAAIEAAGLETAYQNWIDASPDAAWRFNQDAVSTPVVDDTGNGADQTGITGTTVVVGDDPPGFSFDLAAGGTGTAALGLGLQLQAAGARQSAGSAGAGLGLQLQAAGARDSAGAGAYGLGLQLAAAGIRPSLGEAHFVLGLALAGAGPAVSITPGVPTAGGTSPTLVAAGTQPALAAAGTSPLLASGGSP